VKQAFDTLSQVTAKPGEVTGRVKISVSHMAVPFVITPVLPTFRERHPMIDVEIVVEDRLVDLVGEGYDAGVRLTESIDRDMVQLRLTDAFRFVVVGTPGYLAKRGTPRKPEDLLRHECIMLRAPTKPVQILGVVGVRAVANTNRNAAPVASCRGALGAA
jgi:DNA-binding transcriptional LysR family regulator